MSHESIHQRALVWLGALLLVALSSTVAHAAVDLTFRVSVWDDSSMDWELRWVGDPSGPYLSGSEISPETSARPFVGFAQRFRLEWEATSTNGAIEGYRYEFSQVPGASFLPPNVGGLPSFGATQEFVFENDTPASSIVPGNCATGWDDCPEQLRFESGAYLFAVQARDALGEVSDPVDGELTLEINYPPLTGDLDEGGYPGYWFDQAWVSVAPGDTVPDGAYLQFQLSGVDPLFPNESLLPPGEPCCDDRLDLGVPQIRFQSRAAQLVGRDGEQQQVFGGLFGAADVADTVGMVVGPFDSRVEVRAVDEHGRPDPTPSSFEFVGGFEPRIKRVFPAEGDTLLVRLPGPFGGWPANEVPYTAAAAVRYWDSQDLQFHDAEAPGRVPVQGHYVRFETQIDATTHPAETGRDVRAFTWNLERMGVPPTWEDFGGTSPDLSFYFESPVANEYKSDTDPEIFVPNLIWTFPNLFDADSPAVAFREMGAATARKLGELTLQARVRTTVLGDEYEIYPGLRPDPGLTPLRVSTQTLGRVSPVTEMHFGAYLGLDPANTGSVTRVWPDAAVDAQFPLATALGGGNVFDLIFAEPVTDFGLDEPTNFRVLTVGGATAEPAVIGVQRIADDRIRVILDAPLSTAVEYEAGYRNLRDRSGNAIQDWWDVPLEVQPVSAPLPGASRLVELDPNYPNPFNPHTVLRFRLEREARAKLEIFDLAGRRVRVLFDRVQPAGEGSWVWDGADGDGRSVASGVYTARLSAQDQSQTRRMVLLR